MKITIVMNLLCDITCDALKDIDTICPKVDEVLGNFSSDKPSLIITLFRLSNFDPFGTWSKEMKIKIFTQFSTT
jgi:hypothetical protein